MCPTPTQADALAVHCTHARFVWNPVEQLSFWCRGQRVPGYAEQDRQSTEERAAFEWLGAGSSTVQQQALRDVQQAMRNWRGGTHRRPTWRKRGRREGFRVVGGQARRVGQLSRRWCRVLIPTVGWVKFRRTCGGPDARSYRVTLDAAGCWHIAFAAVPGLIPGPGEGSVVGIDRGVRVTLALSDGAVHQAPAPADTRRVARALARCRRGSRRRARAKARLARLRAGNADVNAARDIGAGRVVTARGATGLPVTVNREPQHVASSVA